MNITYGLAQARFNSDRAIKLEYIYVSWDMTYVFEVEIYFWPVPPLVTVCHFQTKETLRSRLTFLLLLPLTFFCRSPFFSFLLFQALNLFLWYRNTDRVTLWKRSKGCVPSTSEMFANFFYSSWIWLWRLQIYYYFFIAR